MKKKTYAILTVSLSFGGAERVISVLLEEYAKRGMKTILIMLGHDKFYKIPSSTKLICLSNLSGSEHPIIKLFYLPIWALRLVKIIKKYNLKAIQSHLYPANLVNILGKLFGAKHKVFIANRGVLDRFKNEGILRQISVSLIKLLYPFADGFVVLSQVMKEDFVQNIKIKSKIHVINNPYDFDSISKQKLESFSNNEFVPVPNKKYIISVGRLIETKNPILLIKAFALVANIYADVELIICGKGNLEKECVKLTNEINYESRIHFLGVVSNPFKYMKASSMFILTSNFEGFPNSLVEALACKLPVISTDCKSGPREILAPDTIPSLQLQDKIEFAKYGVLVPINNAEILSKAIIKLLSDGNLSDSYIQRSTNRLKSYAVSKIADQYFAVFNS